MKLNKVVYYIKATKPTKVIYVFLPLFGYLLTTTEFPSDSKLLYVFAVLGLFWLFYGGVYVLNDIFDFNDDRKDKIKKERIIASGKVSLREAWTIAVLLIVSSLLVTYLYYYVVFLMLLTLLMMNIVYDLYVKKVPYLDSIFINFTVIVKIMLGMCMSVSLAEVWQYIGLLSIVYLATLGVAFEKKQKELWKMQFRKFVKGNYTEEVISFLQIILIIPQIVILIWISDGSRLYLGGVVCIYVFFVALVQNSSRYRIRLNDIGEVISQGFIADDVNWLLNHPKIRSYRHSLQKVMRSG